MITPFTTPMPSRTSPGTFSDRFDVFLGELPTFGAEANALATDVNASAATVASNAIAASVAAGQAQATVTAVAWVSGTTYPSNRVVYSTVNQYLYRRIVAGAGTTDPSADTTNWALNTISYSNVQSFAGFNEAYVAMGTSNIDLNLAGFFSKTITTGTTFTVSNIPAMGKGVAFVLDITNGGAYTITWWSGIKWPSGAAPTLTASGRDSIGFKTYDGGTTWDGFVLGKDLR